MQIPYKSKKEVLASATDFYHNYPRFNGNVYHIAEVIELDLGIDISPEPNLCENYEVDAFTTGDFTRIVIDETLLWRFYGRYRFTLAHEVGHIVLHQDTLKNVGINTVNDWIQFHKTLGDNGYKEMERQSNLFASYLLIPEPKLNAMLEEKSASLKESINYYRKHGRPSDSIKEIELDNLARDISTVFDVSIAAARVRINQNLKVAKLFAV
jgi:hypothetical protein